MTDTIPSTESAVVIDWKFTSTAEPYTESITNQTSDKNCKHYQHSDHPNQNRELPVERDIVYPSDQKIHNLIKHAYLLRIDLATRRVTTKRFTKQASECPVNHPRKCEVTQNYWYAFWFRQKGDSNKQYDLGYG